LRTKRRILLIHGLGEHSARHLHTVDSLLEKGFEVIRFDLRGSGVSGGDRQWIEKFDDYVEDASRVYNWIYTNLPKLPLIVLGHSLGGAIAIYFTARYQKELSGLILSAPAFIVGDGISALKIAIGKMVAGFFPRLKIPKSLGHNWISRDPEAVEAYANDPLACHFNTLNQGNEILKALEKIPEQAVRLTLPIVIFHGTGDRIICPLGSFELIKLIPSPSKELHFLPGGYHEPHNDIDKENYFSLLGLWLARQLKQEPQSSV
jgi:alpha-beta hydrolase superfamily lysophospholipase